LAKEDDEKNFRKTTNIGNLIYLVMSKIKSIKAREILASGGTPSVEAEVELESGVVEKASVSFGVSAGKHEAAVIFDGDMDRYGGKGMLKAVENIENQIAAEILGMEVTGQREIDEKMIKLDKTEDKSNLGGNAILAVSMAVARAAAKDEGIPLYKYLGRKFEIDGNEWILPIPMMVMIEGGKHAVNTTDIQEYLCMPKGLESAKAAIERNQEIYSQLGEVLKKNGLSTNVGNEGAYAPDGIESNEIPLKYLVEAIETLGLKPGEDAVLGIDAAASEFYREGKYNLDRDGVSMDGENLIEYWLKWIEKYPIATVEDLLFEDDWENWTKLTARLPSGVLNIGDDLTATNSKRWQKAIDTKAANSILIKLNQAGTVSETMDCCILAKVHGLPTIPSHRGGGETDDTFLVDLAVAVGSKYIKVGPTRGERVVKYNRLMEIEEEMF